MLAGIYKPLLVNICYRIVWTYKRAPKESLSLHVKITNIVFITVVGTTKKTQYSLRLYMWTNN